MIIDKKEDIKKCPYCHKLFYQLRFISYNTLGAIFWTDGRMIAPFCPDFHKLVKCASCKSLFWIWEARKIGEAAMGMVQNFRRSGRLADYLDTSGSDLHEPHSPLDLEVSTLPSYLCPSDSDYLAYLKSQNTLDDNKVRYVRMRAWWAANDYFRKELRRRKRRRLILGQSIKTQDNMRILFEILEQTEENQRLLKAEIARELGDFELAEQLLSYEYSEKRHSDVVFLKDLTEQRNIKVAQFPSVWP